MLGATIYILWRKDTLLVFSWIQSIGFSEWVDQMRMWSQGILPWIPEVLLYSFPDGCWTYSYTAAMQLVWRSSTDIAGSVWILGGIAAALCAEFGQKLGIVPGAFDWIDILAYIVSFCFATYFVKDRTCRIPQGILPR